MTEGKNKKIKTTKIHLFLLLPFSSQDGGLLQPPPPNFKNGTRENPKGGVCNNPPPLLRERVNIISVLSSLFNSHKPPYKFNRGSGHEWGKLTTEI